MVSNGFVVVGTDKIGDTRTLELSSNKFFIATLFQPQLSSSPEDPHKLILAYLINTEEFSRDKHSLKMK